MVLADPLDLGHGKSTGWDKNLHTDQDKSWK